MGWIFTKSLGGYASPQSYMDAQFTYRTENITSNVVRSGIIAQCHVYYAAIEYVNEHMPERRYATIFCQLAFPQNDKNGYVFGFMDVEENVAPQLRYILQLKRRSLRSLH